MDINNAAVFQSFDAFWSGYIKKLKVAGKADTTHHPEVPAPTQRAFHILFGHLLRLLNAQNDLEYEALLQKLPEQCQKNYHALLQKAVLYIVVMFDCRRGQEGLSAMNKDFFSKEFNESTQMFYYEKTRGEASKNHGSDSEDISNSGIILFDTDEYGYNPGELMEIYLNMLNPEQTALFQRVRVPSKKFNIRDAPSLG